MGYSREVVRGCLLEGALRRDMEEPNLLPLCVRAGGRLCYRIQADDHTHMVEKDTSAGRHVGGGPREGYTH
jgi:hypothetical protein